MKMNKHLPTIHNQSLCQNVAEITACLTLGEDVKFEPFTLTAL